MTSAIKFIKEVKSELKKVTWPSRKETLSSTYLVIVMVIFLSGFIGLVDYFLGWVVKAVLK